MGKLGLITRLKLRLLPEVPVKRELRQMNEQQYLALLGQVQAQWRLNQTLPAWLDETEFFWITQPVNVVSWRRAKSGLEGGGEGSGAYLVVVVEGGVRGGANQPGTLLDVAGTALPG